MSENLQIPHPLLTFRIGCRGFAHKIEIYEVEAKDWKQALQIFKAEMPDAKPVLIRVK